MSDQTFHLGLCMAGSVSAGAYTAGVMDYLLEALQNWEKARIEGDPSIPSHKVEIDLLGGASGGGITSAMAFFAFRDPSIKHPTLELDGRTFGVDVENNIFWKVWVELTGEDVFDQMLDSKDIDDYHIPSALNADFIDQVSKIFKDYITTLKASGKAENPPFISAEAELFMTLFNVTGLKYQINSKALSATEQFISEHRDLAHFKWSNAYEKRGRMEISFEALHNLNTLIEASKATGAFPIGLKARMLERKAKYIWDNPFFQKNNKFNQTTISLGKKVENEEDIYKSLIADGGTSNNEPVELMRDLLMQIRFSEQAKKAELDKYVAMDDTEKMEAKSNTLLNTSVILIDPFPSYDFDIKVPTRKNVHIFNYAPDLVFAMNSQLQFDAKDAIEAYDKNNYGLHVIAPSREDAEKPEFAIACGALAGFGGFLSKEFRIHDFFLGRHNCQSFLRKYFVVDPEEKPMNDGKPNENYECVKAVIQGYENEAALNRFCFTDEKGKKWIPIIPDITLKEPIQVKERKINQQTRVIEYEEVNSLPLYKLKPVPNDFLDKYYEGIKERINKLMNNVYDSSRIVDFIAKIVVNHLDNKVTDKVIEIIKKDLITRKIMEP